MLDPVDTYIGLGANLGDARSTLDMAFTELASLPKSVLRAASSLYSTAPIDSSGPDYLNAVILLQTRLRPIELLDQLQRIEMAHGRQRPFRNAPRTLDLDILLYGDQLIATERLTVPHPRMHQRAFVLQPLAELAPHADVPGQGTISGLLQCVASQRIDKL